MDKLLEFGRRAWFVVRVMSGYEERRIRSYRLHLQKRLEMAQARKAQIRKLPEQVILSEVREMVEQMKAVNRQLEETEAAIEEYFKPIDKSAEIIMDMQLRKEEMQMKELKKMMQHEIVKQKEIAMEKAEAGAKDANQTDQNSEQIAQNQPNQEAMK